MCLFNICNKSAAVFRRAAWRPGAVKPDNGPKHCWLIITLGFTAPCLSVNSRGLFFLFFPLSAAVDITFCKGRLEQIQSVTFRRQPSVSSSHTLQLYQREARLSRGHQKNPTHSPELIWPPWQVAAHPMDDCHTANARQGSWAPWCQAQSQYIRRG